MTDVRIKFCGIRTAEMLETCITLGADFVGFVHYPKSPRHVSIEEISALAAHACGRIQTVAVLVDADDATLATLAATPLDFFQLHGGESPARAAHIKQMYGKKIIRAVRVENAADIESARAYESVADWLLFDAKAPAGALPGGNGLAFDWKLLTDVDFKTPWMLSGGLNANNAQQAIRESGARAVDVSSGIERVAGVKDAGLMQAMMGMIHRL